MSMDVCCHIDYREAPYDHMTWKAPFYPSNLEGTMWRHKANEPSTRAVSFGHHALYAQGC